MLHTIARRSLLVAIATAACWGCGGAGDGLPRKPLSGKVTLDGEPLDGALITFLPEAPGEGATSAAARVTAGAFSVPAEAGLVAGKYKVSVSVLKEIPKKGAKKADAPAGGAADEFDVSATKESIPARYNARTELSADVTEAGPNEYAFTLSSKK